MKKFLIATMLVSFSAANASAADLAARPIYTKAPVISQLYDWTGLYVGIGAGAARGDIDALDVTPPLGGFFTDLVPAGTEGFRFRNTSYAVGFHGGAQYQWQQVVLGVEGTYTFTDINQTIISPYFPDSDRETGRVRDLVTVVGRLGVAFDRWMIYGKGGYAGGNVSFSARDTVAVVSYDQKLWQDGYAVGAGFDYALTSNIRLGLDYTHIELSGKTSSGFNILANGTPSNPDAFRTSAKIDTLMARLSYSYGLK